MRAARILLGISLAFVASMSLLAQNSPVAKTVKAVRFGKLWDAKGKVLSNAIVLVEGDKIRSVTTDSSAIPTGAEVLDLSKYTGLPGLDARRADAQADGQPCAGCGRIPGAQGCHANA